MYLQSLKLHNFRCFQSMEMEFHEKLTVLVGGNGTGKTAVMEGAAIAAGTMLIGIGDLKNYSINKADAYLRAYTIGSSDDVQAQYPVDISAKGVVGGRQGEWRRSLNSANGNTTKKDAKFLTEMASEYQSRLQEGDQSLILPVIAYYGTGRLWDYHREKRFDTFGTNTRVNGYIDCLDGTANIKLMMNWFKKMTILKYQRQEEALATPELETVYQAMEACFAAATEYENVKVRYNLNSNELDVYYTDETGMRMRIPLNQLSAGYKGTISLIADIAYRMAILNPQLLDKVLQETDGIVLIDEIDLHLHPKWQQHILENLTKIFPKVQFIVSTHAPAVISSAKSENLIILKEGQALQLENQVYGKAVKSVLEEIMGVTERPPEVAKLFTDFYQYLASGNFDGAEERLDEIDQLRDYHDPEVAGCRVKLKLERMRGGRP